MKNIFITRITDKMLDKKNSLPGHVHRVKKRI